ncbi:J domain-containing protein [Grimontia sp. S25]|uniref:J domain-containing protein n=1 Tax=Grimontia sedimenti TaxID=2711294 RepID=A0A6M1RIU5_9GAMM|nr:J domain-containing protein [Grimontia sedimenti]NGO00231.1 J domain-containing protein [Grimontia sedimenti]
MNMWATLDLEPTQDESVIKKAYRVKLRQHHPEDDPEGFKRVREAYENILQWLKGGADDNGETNRESAPENPETATEHPHISALKALLQDASKRMELTSWKVWTETGQMLQIDEQQKISDDAVTLVLANRWLPPAIIDVLWHGLSWNLLLNGDQQQVELGEFLNEWRQLPLSVSLEELTQLSASEQRAVLSFLRPLHIALSRGQVDALHYHLLQPLTFVMPNLLNVQISLLKAHVAIKTASSSVVEALVSDLIERPAETLTLAQWEVIAEAAKLIGHSKAIETVTEKLLLLNAWSEAADLQYFSVLSQDRLLALVLACLRQRWNPLPPVFWRNERKLLEVPESAPEKLMYDWLCGQLVGHDNNAISHRLDFTGAEGSLALVVKVLWAAHSGSWAWMHSLKQALKQELDALGNGSERVAILLAQQCLKEVMETQGGSETLQQKLAHYETDAFFSQEALTMEELSSLSKDDWLECIRRHPLLPDTWYRQLEQAEVLVMEELHETNMYPNYADSLCFYRSANPEYEIASVWQETAFEGVFDWALMFFSHLGAGGALKQPVMDSLPPLPERQLSGPISLILPFAAKPHDYLPESIDAFTRFPEQFVYRLVVDSQVSLLIESESIETLMERAKARDLCATIALSRLLAEEHFDEAIVFWNLVAANLDANPHFHVVVDWQQQTLIRLKQEKGLAKETYHYDKPEFIHAMITTNMAWFAPPQEFEQHSPSKEAEDFHYPICILLTQLHLGLNGNGYNTSSLKALADRRPKQTKLQQQTTDVAVAYLEEMYQTQLEKDLATKGKHAASYSRFSLKAISLVLFVSSLIIFPNVSAQGAYLDKNSLYGAISAFLFGQIYLAWKVSRPMILNDDRKKYFIYAALTCVVALVSRSLFLAFVNLIANYSAANGLSEIYGRGGWNKTVVKSGKVNLRKVLGFKS